MDSILVIILLPVLLICIIFVIIISIYLKRRKNELTPKYSEMNKAETVSVSPMRTFGLIVVELCFIVAGFFAINYFVENVLNPDYTVDWKVYPNWESIPYAKEKDVFRTTQEDKDMYVRDIMGQRLIDRSVLFFAFGLLIAGYYCDKKAHNEIKRRGEIIPADGTETLDGYTIQSNRRIVGLRFIAVLLFMWCLFFVIMIVLGNPMKRGVMVDANPYYRIQESVNEFLFILIMPIGLLIAPHFALRKISNIYSFKYGLTLFAGMAVFAVVCIFVLHISSIIAAYVASASGLFGSYAGKMNRIAKILGM